jgi:hypothetical protein
MPPADGASKPTIGLALMVYNEATDLQRLLESVEGAFDQIALVDNANPGSDDGTVDLFRDWCSRTGQAHVIGSFEWIDDYSAKRNYTDSLLTTDWRAWADADAVVYGAYNLRRVASKAPTDLAAFTFSCQLGDDFAFPRQQLVRRGRSKWVGRVHEMQRLDGPTIYLGPEIAFWFHRPKTPEQFEASRERDRRIYEKADSNPLGLAQL